jgi:hypothetical protein
MQNNSCPTATDPHDDHISREVSSDYRPLARAIHEAGDAHSGLILTTAKRWPRHDPGAPITALDDLLTGIAATAHEEDWLDETRAPTMSGAADFRSARMHWRDAAHR